MSLLGDIRCTCMSDMFYLKRNLPMLLASSLVSPLLYLVAFGWGLGNGVTVSYGGTEYSYIAYMVPGVVALTTLTAGFTTVSNKIMVQRRFYESFDEMMLCPISKTSIILGKAILGIIKALMCGAIMLLIGCLLVNDLCITPMLIVSVFVASLSFAMLGVAAGMLMPDLPHMTAFSTFVILPMTFLCGTMFPVDRIPSVVGWIVQILPLTPASACIRAAALGAEFPWISFGILVVWMFVFYFLARYALSDSE